MCAVTKMKKRPPFVSASRCVVPACWRGLARGQADSGSILTFGVAALQFYS